MQKNLAQYLDPANHRQPKTADGVYLMEHITCPGILIECGFLSNADEEQLLQQPDYQKKMAAAMPPAAAVSPPVKAPSSPWSMTASRTPLASR